MSICERKALAPTIGRPGTVEGPQSQQGAAQAAAGVESQKLIEAMVPNVTGSFKAYILQNAKGNSMKSALLCLTVDQAILFNLLTAHDFKCAGQDP